MMALPVHLGAWFAACFLSITTYHVQSIFVRKEAGYTMFA